MTYTKPLFIFLAIIALFAACNPAGKMIKEGDKLRSEGKHEDASTYYYNALLHKPKNVKAKEGLAVTAQLVLNDKFVTFNKQVVENNVDEAMKTYKNAEKYNKTAQSVGVELRWPTEYDEVYIDIRSEYIAKLYDEALVMMNEKRYEQAEQQFERIASLDSSYRGITVLRLNTVLEPLYQNGMMQLNQGKYKQAYQTFSKIVQQDDTYKDAKARKDEAINKATITVGVLPVKSITDSASAMADLDEFINERLQQHNFAYVKVSSGKEFIQSLESRGWGNIKDVEKAAEAGRNLGLKYVLLVTASNINYKETPLTTEQRNAYEAFSENILNPYTGTYSAITKFRKVTYDDTHEKHLYKLDIQYQLISTADGKVVMSNTISPEQKDEQHQLVYKGNINNVYEELPTGNYLPPINQEWRDLFTNVKREPLSKAQLANEAHRQAARQIAAAVTAYFK
jgi:tetratricopeptide (TPR) repeat protein